MKAYKFLNFTLVKIVPIIILIIALSQMFIDGTVFTYLKVGPMIFHALTALALCYAYCIGCERLKFLPIPSRQIYSASLVVAGIHFYDFFWGIGSLLSLKKGFPWGAAVSLFIASLLLVFLDKQNIFLKITNETWSFFTVMLISFCFMALTGFYTKMSLYDLGMGSDPNVDNFWWILSKFSGLIVIPVSTWTGEESKEVRMPFT